uniref:Uncharacterized protein n=1 Tax=Anguilla anguilla TaxID=7936 RepID=A0A0E9RHC0_ANGAN
MLSYLHTLDNIANLWKLADYVSPFVQRDS